MLSDPQLHYLDNAATSRVDPAVAQAVSEALTELWANPSSLYDPAVESQLSLETARARVAKTLNCRSDEVYFTAFVSLCSFLFISFSLGLIPKMTSMRSFSVIFVSERHTCLTSLHISTLLRIISR